MDYDLNLYSIIISQCFHTSYDENILFKQQSQPISTDSLFNITTINIIRNQKKIRN